MGNKDEPFPLEALFAEAYPFVSRAAQVRSARVIHVLRAAALDRVDLEQEIIDGLLSALVRFDPVRSSLPTFVDRVVTTRTASVLRKAAAQKRTPNAILPVPEPVHLLLVVERRIDLNRALKKLSKRDRKVAWLLTECKPSEVVRVLGISRGAVYRCIDRIRAVLAEVGFE